MVEVPGLGSFELKPFSQRPYEFVLSNPEIANLYVWNPDKWETSISSQTGQFLIDFRSKFLQFSGIDGVRRFVSNLVNGFCCALLLDEQNGWERISRVDLACDSQAARGLSWDDLPRYVSRSRKNEGCADSAASEIAKAKELLEELSEQTPQRGNKGVSTYTVCAEQLEILQKAIKAAQVPESQDGYIYRALYTRQLQTIYFGRFGSSLFARRYDKLATLKIQKKEYLADIWKKMGWDGESPVTRTEFSLSSKFLRGCAFDVVGEYQNSDGQTLEYEELKRLDLRDFEEFLKYIPCIWRYLTHNWLRLTIPDSEDSNKWRWQLDPEWETIQTAFPSFAAIKRLPPIKQPDDPQLAAQLKGVALSLAAKRAENDDCTESAASVLHELAGYFAADTYLDKLFERRQVLGLDDFSEEALTMKLRAEWLRRGEGS
jgi:hypothetical protein